MSRTQADLLDTREHRRQTARQVRHEARAALHHAVHEDWLEDADARCPKETHDLGRHDSPPPHRPPKAGRRGGFKVWKTPYWKRRKALRRQRNAELRQLSDQP